MKTLIPKQLLIALGAIFGLALVSHSQAQTFADVDIDNTATITFNTGGSNISIISTPTGNSDVVGGGGTNAAGLVTTFKVDRLINFAVSEEGDTWNLDGSAVASIGENGVVLAYTVTNSSNAPLGFDLHAEANGSGMIVPTLAGFTVPAVVPAAGATFTPASVTIAVDNPSAGASGTYDAADTATVINTIAPGDSARVFVVVDVPATASQDQYALVTLVAQSAETDGSYGNIGLLITTDGNGNASPGNTNPITDVIDDATVQDVFNDGASDATYDFVAGGSFVAADAVRNGQSSDTDGVLINGANLKLTKVAEVIWDPINLASKPKAIPGAYVKYTLTIENTGGDTANLTTLVDALAAEITADEGLLNPLACNPATLDGAPDASCTTQFTGNGSYTTSTTEGRWTFTNTGAGTSGAGFLLDTKLFTTGNVSIIFNTTTGVLAKTITGNTGSDGDLEAGEIIVIEFNASIN
jgi:uncharacterized repeat protein (TIGR01451 family)